MKGGGESVALRKAVSSKPAKLPTATRLNLSFWFSNFVWVSVLSQGSVEPVGPMDF